MMSRYCFSLNLTLNVVFLFPLAGIALARAQTSEVFIQCTVDWKNEYSEEYILPGSGVAIIELAVIDGAILRWSAASGTLLPACDAFFWGRPIANSACSATANPYLIQWKIEDTRELTIGSIDRTNGTFEQSTYGKELDGRTWTGLMSGMCISSKDPRTRATAF